MLEALQSGHRRSCQDVCAPSVLEIRIHVCCNKASKGRISRKEAPLTRIYRMRPEWHYSRRAYRCISMFPQFRGPSNSTMKAVISFLDCTDPQLSIYLSALSRRLRQARLCSVSSEPSLRAPCRNWPAARTRRISSSTMARVAFCAVV